jgi:hypothetical protein
VSSLDDAQRVLLTGYALGLGSGVALTALCWAHAALQARRRYRYALRRNQALSDALRASVGPSGLTDPPMPPRVPVARRLGTVRYPTITSNPMAN